MREAPRLFVPHEGRKAIDPNRADHEALMSIRGIGRATAERIVHAREERPFSSLRDSRESARLAPAVWDTIRDRIRIE